MNRDAVSIALIFPTALGDSIIAKKVFDTIVAMTPNCYADIFCSDRRSREYAEAFYGGSTNLNRIFDATSSTPEYVENYDLVLQPEYNIPLSADLERLKRLSPALCDSIMKVENYNRRHMYNKDFAGRMLFDMARARILKLNRYTSLSCDGAFPIHDNRVEIKILPEWKVEFDKLGLKKYITVGSNGGDFERHSIKEWAMRYYVEFVSLFKSEMPDTEVVQLGGNGVTRLENADRHLLGENLELVKYVLKYSLLHVDSEGGLVHLASQLETKCLVLFGVTDIQYYGFTNNINLSAGVCGPCYWAWNSDRECLLGAKEPPCMLAITPRKVFDLACRYLQSLQ